IDAQFLAGQTPDLPKLQLQLRELKLDEIELEIGRPRTEAYIVYVFLMLRGWGGGCKDQHARLLLQESMTLKLWLEHLGLELPPASTLSDNLNAVSNPTRSLIHEVQLRYILQGGLDDFQKCFIDSTAVEANTERPTDSTILVRLIARVRATGGNLHRLDVCERRVMEQEKVPVADKIISLSDSDASFIVKGGWNAEVGYRPQLARS